MTITIIALVLFYALPILAMARYIDRKKNWTVISGVVISCVALLWVIYDGIQHYPQN